MIQLNERQQRRFWSHVSKGIDCWEWTGPVSGDYGRISFNGTQLYAHRIAYTLGKIDIPNTLVVDHICCNTLCVNPKHLELVSIGENVRRGKSSNRLDKCKRGHLFTDNNIYLRKDGRRECRICRSNSLYRLSKFERRLSLLQP